MTLGAAAAALGPIGRVVQACQHHQVEPDPAEMADR